MMSDEENKSLFRRAPKLVTPACNNYMERVSELRGFIGLFFQVVKGFAEITSSMPDLAETKARKENLRRIVYNYSSHEQLVNEIMLSRAVETFDLYLISILKSIFLAKPEMLKSEGKIDVSVIIELKEYDQIVLSIVEKKLHELAYKPLLELQEYIRSRTGIELFATREIFDTVVLESEVRNLIAHNNCYRNEIFDRRTKDVNKDAIIIDQLDKVLIRDEWMRVASYTLDGVVFDFDKNASKKFGLPVAPPNLFPQKP